MLELRKDYILDRWVIISEKRSKRPKQFHKIEVKKNERVCYFCPGSESFTPHEIGRIEERGKWKIRWFPNKFPAVSDKGSPQLSKKGIADHGAAYGYHEVIVETPTQKKQLDELSADHIAQVLRVYAERITTLSKKKGIKYVLVFKNHGREGGTSIIHSHSQVIAYNLVPEVVKQEAQRSVKSGKCSYCDILTKERKSPRLVKENKTCLAICPYASRFNYEVWLFPKKHLKNITDFDEQHITDMAKLLKHVLSRLRSVTDSYNFALHYSPQGKNLHFHIEVCPRIATWGGFEIGSGHIINSISPESAARFLR